MYILKSITIEDFWGQKKIFTEFDKSVNVFIGQNGTGKTTLMNIIYGILTVNSKILGEVNFKKIDIRLCRLSRNRKISVEIIENNNILQIKYKIGNQVFEFPLYVEEYNIRTKRLHPTLRNIVSQCKTEMSKLVSINWLSVYREIFDDESFEEDRYYNRRPEVNRSSVDAKIEELLKRVTSYYLNIEFQANLLTQDYQSDVLAGLLYNESFDKFSIDKDSNLDPEVIRKDLHHAYRDLNSLNPKIEKRIEKHIKAITKSLSNLEQSISGKESIDLNDVLPIVLLRRTNYIINLSKKLEIERNKLFSSFNKYIKQLSNFIKDKKIELSPASRYPIRITKNNLDLQITELSSGEKQLFILLTETLLQKNEDYIFIADEPELSLHIEWQKMLLSSIQELNPNSQIIVATHSPEIAALWRNKIIKMENIIE